MKKQVVSDALWVDVGDYFVTRDGRIFKTRNRRNAKKRKVREVKQFDHGDGYLQFKYNGQKVRSHRFIAEAFISNPDNLPEVNHKSEVKNQNDVLGLEWCDRTYNNNFGTRNEKVANALSKRLFQYALDGSFIQEWQSTMEVERQLGYASGSISKCCRGKQKSAYGYVWRYSD